MTIPPPLRIQSMDSAKNCPRRLAEAPRAMKTRENPAMKQAAFRRSTRRVRASPCRACRSVKETPARYERYEGTRGRTQGERKEKTPAPSATRKDRLPAATIACL